VYAEAVPKNLVRMIRRAAAVLWLLWLAGVASAAQPPSLPWKECLRQPVAWYAGPEARRIAENVLLYQLDCGGWAKNVEMAAPLTPEARAKVSRRKGDRGSATIDNGATYTQLRFLARTAGASREPRFHEAICRGLDFLLTNQYGNGGWPQFPHREGYYRHITFNDDAMIGVMELLREAARGAPPYDFLDGARRAQSAKAVEKGIECILNCQVIVNGKRTVWCAQHDEATLAPAPARSYELVSLSGGESVGIVRFLMGVENPPPRLVEAVHSAAAWFDQARLTGLKLVRESHPSKPKGYDLVVVADAGADPLWGRFYEIDTQRPFFCGRDGVKKYRLADIEHERRVGYSWYTSAPAKLLTKDYPAWQAKWSPERCVLSAH
jgi:PelA/Pel-15E family pectate lyase